MIWTYLLIKSVNLIRKILNIKNTLKKILKWIKDLFQKSKELKFTQYIPKYLDSKINLLILRDTFTDKSTIGELFLNDEFMCDTLENPYINNERNISCIPEGQYSVRLRTAEESATRDYLHLLVKDVPNRDYILFHIGNSAKDTSGCILVGIGRKQDFVQNSALAMDLLMKEIINLGGEKVNLIIKNK
jgi:hypothetical protein